MIISKMRITLVYKPREVKLKRQVMIAACASDVSCPTMAL